MDVKQYGELMRRRALGLEPEMESAKQLVRILQPLYVPGMTILDVGCGCGHFLRSLREMDPDIEYTGIDTNADYIQMAREIWYGARFEEGNVEVSLPVQADSVTCVTVLQNLRSYRHPLRMLWQAARRFLVVRLLLSNMEHLTTRVEPGNQFLTHYNTFAEADVVNWLERLGASAVQVLPDECDIDLPRTDDPTQTYTIRTETGERLQVNGVLLLRWKWIVASKAV